jgi:diaminopimelate epimerase
MQKLLKMHGLENDFIILDKRKDNFDLSVSDIVSLADRENGQGCDQLLVMENPADSNADIFMRIYNADGSEVAACGNGTRCVARLYMDDNNIDECIIETSADLLQCKRSDNDYVEVDMGEPKFDWQDIPLSEEQDTLSLDIDVYGLQSPVAVNIGNPHMIFFVDNLEEINIADLGPALENHPLFPERTNVEFVQILSSEKLRMRVWERGAGVTKACGTGACATAVAAARRGLADRKSEIILDGGSLFLEWRKKDGHIVMTGPAEYMS